MISLQMGNKTAATSSCEHMILNINLPDDDICIDEIELAVEKDRIKLFTKLYKLDLPLTHQIDPDKGNASFDVDKKILKLTLKLCREFDYVNF